MQVYADEVTVVGCVVGRFDVISVLGVDVNSDVVGISLE